jgi:hypothetical protein
MAVGQIDQLQVEGLSAALAAKQDALASYTAEAVDDLLAGLADVYSPLGHGHLIADVSDLQATLDGLAPFTGSRTANALSRWNASGELVDSGIFDDGSQISSAIGRDLVLERFTGNGLQVNNSAGTRLGWAGKTLSVNADGIFVEAAKLDVLDSTDLQFRATNTANTIYGKFGVDASGDWVMRATGGRIAMGTASTTATGAAAIALGAGALAAGYGDLVAGLGAQSTNGGNSVVIGTSARASGAVANLTVVGALASSKSSGGVSLGSGSTTEGFGNVALGGSSKALGGGGGCGAIGGQASDTGGWGSWAIGHGASNVNNYSLVCGSEPYPITTIWGGKGATNAAPTAWGLRGTGGSGTDVVGGDLYLDAGAGTGAGASGTGRLRATAASTTGSTLQSTWMDVLTWDRSKVSITGVQSISGRLILSSALWFDASDAVAGVNLSWLARPASGYLQANAQVGLRYSITGDVLANLSESGMALNRSTAFAARMLEVFDATNPQQRWTQAAGTVYAERQVDSGGIVTDTSTGNQWRFANGAAYLGISVASALVTATSTRSLDLRCATSYELYLRYGSTIRMSISATGLSFYGRPPVARQTMPAALSDATGGTASGTLSAPPTDTVANLAAWAADAIASLADKSNGQRATMIATTLVA